MASNLARDHGPAMTVVNRTKKPAGRAAGFSDSKVRAC